MVNPSASTVPTCGLLLCDDLIFTSRITGTARSLGLSIRSASALSTFQGLARSQTPSCVIVDLAHPGLVIADLMAWLTEHCQPSPRVVAYGSHVDAETLHRARAAGCDPVLPRSKFVEELPGKLGEWLKPLLPA